MQKLKWLVLRLVEEERQKAGLASCVIPMFMRTIVGAGASHILDGQWQCQQRPLPDGDPGANPRFRAFRER